MKQYLPWFLTFVAAPAVGYLIYHLKAKTDVWRISKQADVAAVQTPFTVLQQALAQRDRQIEAKDAQIKELIAGQNVILTNHLKHDAADREAVVKALTEMTSTQRELTEMIRDDRVASAAQREKIHDRLNALSIQVAGGGK